MKRKILKITLGIMTLFVCVYLGFIAGSTSQEVPATGTSVLSAREESSEPSQSAWELFTLTNEERKKASLNQLSYSPYLAAAARDKCNDMVQKDYWSHVSPDGRKPWSFIDHYKVPHDLAAENLAYGQRTASQVINEWMNSESHKKNILDPTLNEVGFGICESQNFVGTGRQLIVVQHFIERQ